MVTKEMLKKDMVSALKAGDTQKVSVMRMMISEVAYGETAAKPISVVDAIVGYRKKLGKAFDEYPTEALTYEMAVVEQYLPKPPSVQELEAFVHASSLAGTKMGVIMKALKAEFPTVSGETAREVAERHGSKG